jgi:hypothetical protein
VTVKITLTPHSRDAGHVVVTIDQDGADTQRVIYYGMPLEITVLPQNPPRIGWGKDGC